VNHVNVIDAMDEATAESVPSLSAGRESRRPSALRFSQQVLTATITITSVWTVVFALSRWTRLSWFPWPLFLNVLQNRTFDNKWHGSFMCRIPFLSCNRQLRHLRKTKALTLNSENQLLALFFLMITTRLFTKRRCCLFAGSTLPVAACLLHCNSQRYQFFSC